MRIRIIRVRWHHTIRENHHPLIPRMQIVPCRRGLNTESNEFSGIFSAIVCSLVSIGQAGDCRRPLGHSPSKEFPRV